jgi:hypothetical protein
MIFRLMNVTETVPCAFYDHSLLTVHRYRYLNVHERSGMVTSKSKGHGPFSTVHDRAVTLTVTVVNGKKRFLNKRSRNSQSYVHTTKDQL